MAKIPWSRIREAYAGEWVELVEFSWKLECSHPHAARVRHHSSNRKQLLERIHASGKVSGSVVLFVGPSIPSVLSSGSPAAVESSRI